MADEWAEFRKEEYQALRGEILLLQGAIKDIERQSAVGSAAIVSFLLIYMDKMPFGWERTVGWWVPVLYVLFNVGIARYKFAEMMRIGSYLKTVETKYSGPDYGWESFRGSSNDKKGTLVRRWWLVTWISLTVATLIPALIATITCVL